MAVVVDTGVIRIVGDDQTEAAVRAARARVAAARAAMRVDADITAANTAIRDVQQRLRTLGTMNPSPRVDADTAAAKRELALLRAQLAGLEDEKNIRVRADTTTASQRIRALMNDLDGVGGAAGRAAGMVSLLGAAGAGLAVAFSAVPGVLASLGGIGGVLVGSFNGVGDALKGYTTDQEAATKASTAGASAAASNARQIRDAKTAIADAERNAAQVAVDSERRIAEARQQAADTAEQGARAIADAKDRVTSALADEKAAQDELTDSYDKAREHLQDLQDQQRSNALSVEGASIRLEKERIAYDKVMKSATATDLEKRDAAYQLADAQENLTEAQHRSTRSTDDLNEAQAKGIEGSDEVTSAQAKVKSAHEATQKAQENLRQTTADAAEANQKAAAAVAQAVADGARAQADAARQVERAQQGLRDAQDAQGASAAAAAQKTSAYADAMKKLTPEQRELVKQLLAMAPLVKELGDAGAKPFLPGLVQMLKDSEGLFPIFKGYLGDVGEILGDTARKEGELFKNPEFKKNLKAMLDGSLPITRAIGDGLVKLTDRFVAFGAKMAPASEGFSHFLDDVFDGFGQFMDELAPYAGDFKSIWESLGDLTKTFLPQLAKAIGEAARLLAPLLKSLADGAASGTPGHETTYAPNPENSPIKSIGNAANTGIGNLIGISPDAWNKWWDDYDAKMAGFRKDMKDIGPDLARRWDEWTSKISRETGEMWSSVSGWWNRTTTDVSTKAQEAWGNVTNWWTRTRDDASNRASGMWTNVTSWFGRTWTDVTNWGSRTWTDITNWWTRTRDDASNRARDLWSNVTGWGQRTWTDVTNWASRTWGDVTNWWNRMRDNVSTTANQLWSAVTGWAGRIRDSFVGAMNTLATNVGIAWGKLRAFARDPINFMIDPVYNRGVVPVWNAIAGIFGLGRLGPLPGMASGGILPGYSPGKDNLLARGPGGLLALAGGEAIMRPEWTRAVGPGYIHAANAAARGGAASSFVSRHGVPGYADGGIIGAVGGWLDGLWTNATSSVRDGFSGLLNYAIPGGGSFGAGLRKFPGIVIDGAVKAVEKAVASIGIGKGLSGGAGLGVQRWAGAVGQALAMKGQSQGLAGVTLRRMNQESGGNPTVVNRWDSNWTRGTPSVGLMQVIGPTYRAYKDGRRDVGPYSYGVSVDPLSNILASMGYALSRYGSLQSAYGRSGGYDLGGVATGTGILRKDVITPERVLSPSQTAAFEQLVAHLTANPGSGRSVVIQNVNVQGLVDFRDKSTATRQVTEAIRDALRDVERSNS